jgi:diaminohydroxyphosphoribosylaminopyrimidine deaminase/5-amino-6-(5-phosphoribosylamino)uracil reductase
VLTRRGEIPWNCRLWQTIAEAPVCLAGPHADRWTSKVPEGVELIPCDSLTDLLRDLARRRCTNVLVEGGANVLGQFFDERLIDEVHVFIASKLIGGAGPAPIGGQGLERIADALVVNPIQAEALGSDWYFHGKLS